MIAEFEHKNCIILVVHLFNLILFCINFNSTKPFAFAI